MIYFSSQSGFAAFITIVIIGAVSLIMALSASLLGLGELEMGFSEGQSGESFSLAEGCLDEVLYQFHRHGGYPGGTLSIGDGSCIIGVVSAGSNHVITITSSLGSYHDVIEVDMDIDPNQTITINSWKEL